MSMKVIRMSGGLGNQLFQYAFGRALLEEGDTVVKLDTSYLKSNKQGETTVRTFLLDNFNIRLEVLSSFEVLIRKVQTDILSSMKVVKDTKSFGYDAQAMNHKGSCFFMGNWLSPKYFSKHRDSLLKELTLRNGFSSKAQEIAKLIQSGPSVALHVRRGDYVKYQNKFVLLSTGYYQQALEYINEKKGKVRVFVFSDDVEYVKKNLKSIVGPDAVIVSGQGISDYEELILMSLCSHTVIANSSFSWWGAWLNTNADKVVVAPKVLRVDGKDTTEFIPSELSWIQI